MTHAPAVAAERDWQHVSICHAKFRMRLPVDCMLLQLCAYPGKREYQYDWLAGAFQSMSGADVISG